MEVAAAIYCRISRDPQGTNLGVIRQRADCAALADRRGWKVAGIYVDNDFSAYSLRQIRPEYQRMLRDLKEGVVGAVLAWHPDRLHRSPRELEDFIDLVEATGARVATCTAGDYDLATPDGRLMARIVGSVARKESEDKSRRLRRKHEELALNGKVSGGGKRPFGFEQDRMTVIPDEAARIREAARRIAAGDTLYGIRKDWTAQGVKTVTGAPWSTTALKTLLTRARIAGLREHRGAVTTRAMWPAIVDEATWRQVKAILTDSSRRQAPARAYLLTGIIQCDVCGKALVAAPRQSGRAYGCVKRPKGGCGSVYGLAEPIEELVTEAVLVALDGAMLPTTDGEMEDELAKALAADEARLAELAEVWADGDITRQEWLRARERIEDRLGKHRRHIRRRPNVFSGIENVRDVWETLSLDRRRAILMTVLERVVLRPAAGPRNRFNVDRVGFVWRV